ncbi:MAG: VCBS repeat-containing protein [bacterium]|nr:VCBS repeat-containing protein [bacterium]
MRKISFGAFVVFLGVLLLATMPVSAQEPDCNGNGIPDADDIADNVSRDCDVNGVPDECQPDCDGDGGADVCQIIGNEVEDCNDNLLMDECEPDCNGSGLPDDCDVAAGTSADCNGNVLPDECEPDCNGSGFPDDCDVTLGTSPDCNGNGYADECDPTFTVGPAVPLIAPGTSYAAGVADIDGDGVLDIVGDVPSELYWSKGLGGGLFGAQQLIGNAFNVVLSLDLADIDADGDTDVLVGAYGDAGAGEGLNWYENTDGRGSFGPPRQVDPIAWFTKGVTADLDGDGDLDVLSSDGPAIHWQENDSGVVTFGPRYPIGPYAASAVNIVTADVDGDGDPDAVTTTSINYVGHVSWYENPGVPQQGWTEHIIIEGLDAPDANWFDIAAADIDGDGDTDIATGWDDATAWFENLGGGDFGIDGSTAHQLSIGAGYSVTIGDLDLDGDNDVLGALWDSQDLLQGFSFGTVWYENPGQGGELRPPAILFDDYGFSNVVADVDGDGASEVITSHISDGVILRRGMDHDCNVNGSLDFCDIAEGISTDCTGDGAPDECEPDCNGNGAADSCDIDAGASLDCNADGVPDECEPDCNANGQSDLCEILAGAATDCDTNGVPDECEADCDDNGVTDTCDIDAGTHADCDFNGVPDLCDPDCDGDGLPDGCEADCNANYLADICEILSGDESDCDGNEIPDSCETELAFESADVGPPARTLAVGDLDGDGDVDVITGRIGVTWYENAGGDPVGAEHNVPGLTPYSIHPVDLDVDGDLDLLVGAGDHVSWHENLDGAGAFAAAVNISTVADDVDWVYSADLDGDGDMDVAHSAGFGARLVWYRNLGGAQSWSARTIVADGGPSVGAYVVRAADLDGDGDRDLVTPRSWYENTDGNGSFAARPLQTGISYGVFVADMDGDGDPDLLVSDNSPRKIVLFRNLDGAGTFGAAEDVMPIQFCWSLVATDLDGDGDLDVVAGTTTGARTYAALNDGTGGFGPEFLLVDEYIEAVWVRAADLDGDGDNDVVTAGDFFYIEDVTWYRNLSDDCNGEGMPDVCLDDCNLNGIGDVCDLRDGASVDCDGNGVPDECDTTCTGSCDADGDLCADDLDCAPADASLWSAPRALDSLRLTHAAGTTSLSWSPPEHPGADSVWYDALRSMSPDDFYGSAECLEADDVDTACTDTHDPGPNDVDYFLIRVENSCPGVASTMGAGEDGLPRSGASCP